MKPWIYKFSVSFVIYLQNRKYWNKILQYVRTLQMKEFIFKSSNGLAEYYPSSDKSECEFLYEVATYLLRSPKAILFFNLLQGIDSGTSHS